MLFAPWTTNKELISIVLIKKLLFSQVNNVAVEVLNFAEFQ